MATQTTNGIQITVQPSYQAAYSRPAQHRYIFAYEIIIENHSKETVQLLRRHWFIWDANGHVREVEGKGVVGQQPVLPPGGRHRYASWCDLSTGIGKMHGAFQMVNVLENTTFKAIIPTFYLIAPLRLN